MAVNVKISTPAPLNLFYLPYMTKLARNTTFPVHFSDIS